MSGQTQKLFDRYLQLLHDTNQLDAVDAAHPFTIPDPVGSEARSAAKALGLVANMLHQSCEGPELQAMIEQFGDVLLDERRRLAEAKSRMHEFISGASISDERKLQKWCEAIESAISRAVLDCAPREWNEDHITYSWLRAAKNTARTLSLPALPHPFGFSWDAFKADGSLEERHGDVAILVRQRLKDKKEILGAGFLEAKRIYPNGLFSAIRWKQLSEQLQSISHHRLLLYDTEPATVTSEFARRAPPTLAIVVPTDRALAAETRSRDLYSLGFPLSYQLCLRYFVGQDLDYDSDLVKDVMSGAIGGVDYLFASSVSFEVDPKTSLDDLQINPDYWVPIENARETES